MSIADKKTRIVIMGAAGRDFHNFNTVYRDNPDYDVVAFTATQIPEIAGRCYPATLAGELYPQGIPIVEEQRLAELIRTRDIDQVVFAYSDISHTQVMHKASLALASGADFLLLGPEQTMLQASVPVIACCAVRTGCGKSQVTQWLSQLLKNYGLKVAVIRHPMPYGDLDKQAVQRFVNAEDIYAADCTIEEREEYEPHIALGNIIYAGVDYAEIVARAEKEADIILWDGGNNDFSFIQPDLHIVLVDPLRPENVTSHHPGEAVLRMADIILIVKVNSAAHVDIQTVSESAHSINPAAPILHGASIVQLDQPELVRDKRVLVVEDGPTITHGGMPYGAGYVAASQAHAAEIIDPRYIAVDEIAQVYAKYAHIGHVLPAVGYHPEQLQALTDTINAADVDTVVSATPCDLAAIITINKPVVRAKYKFAEVSEPGLAGQIESFLKEKGIIDG
jgi:predicted GTPase